MSDMNSALSVWQLVIIIAIPLALLCGWITAVFVAAREPRADAAAAASLVAPADEGAGATVGGQDQPMEPPARRLAA